MGRFRGKTVVVTGAGSGLGSAYTQRLISEGASVLALDVTDFDAPLTQGSAEIEAMVCDVTNADHLARAFDRVRAKWGRLDVLFNNAGIGLGGRRLHETSIEIFDKVMNVNTRGAFMVMKHALAIMIEARGGAIVNTASNAAFKANATNGSYSMSKGAVVQMTRQAALEYARDGIRINAVCPGLTRTNILRGVDEKKLADIASAIPMGRIGTPEEVAAVALFLASDDASYVTGSCYLVDGGHLCA